MIPDEHVIDETKKWLETFIVSLNICPFAKREIERNSLKIQVAQAQKMQEALEELLLEMVFLDKNTSVETTLLIFPSLFRDFFDYLDFVDYAELLIQKQEYEGVYQLATFHPDYCFADTDFDDVSNYTNRSPYPMIHLLREDSLEKAIDYYGDTENIFENNIATLRKLGLKKTKKLLGLG